MSLMAPIKDGQVVESESQNSLKKANAGKNGMDKDAFLQLLVAQMQYQDPLEPTSNTEYIAQYATFSQVEQMQNMAATSELARASSLVGEEVYVKTTNSSGDTKYIYGKVDYVVFEAGKAYLAINEELYSLDDLDTVVDAEYKAAYDKAMDFTETLNKLPKVTAIDMSNAETIDNLKKIYEGMTEYEKSFLATDTVKRYNEYVVRLEEVRNAAGEADKNEKPSEGEGEDGDGDANEDGDSNVKPEEGAGSGDEDKSRGSGLHKRTE